MTGPIICRNVLPMTHSEFIDALGGGTKIAEWLTANAGEHVDREAVYKWKELDRIPWRWRSLLIVMAKDASITVPKDFLPGIAA